MAPTSHVESSSLLSNETLYKTRLRRRYLHGNTIGRRYSERARPPSRLHTRALRAYKAHLYHITLSMSRVASSVWCVCVYMRVRACVCMFVCNVPKYIPYEYVMIL